MRVIIDQARCEGHGMCEFAAPEQFALDDDGVPQLRHTGAVPTELEAAVADAVRACPVAALRTEP